MKVKIISDGTSFGTKVIDSETNTILGRVQKIKWEISSDDCIAICTLEVAMTPVEIGTEANIKILSNTKEDTTIKETELS